MKCCSTKVTHPVLSLSPTVPVQHLPMMQIRATDAAGATKMMDTLGTGDALLSKINKELEVCNHDLRHTACTTFARASCPDIC
jgi:hypothetical protein